MDGLNEYLQPLGAPVTADRGFINNIVFDTTYQDNSVTTIKIPFLSASKITTGTLVAGVNVGSVVSGAYLQIDGINNRITVNDGTTTRIVIGSV